MQSTRIAIFLLITLSACTTQSGNYAKLSDAYNTQIATDTTRQLVAFYPPASTHFVLSQVGKDTFGVALQKDLRESGYGIEVSSSALDWFNSSSSPSANKTDFHSDRIQKTDPDATHQAAPVTEVKTDTRDAAVKNNPPPSISARSMPLSYIVDAIGEDLYRVTIKSGTASISRVYSIAGGSLSAAGAWTRKE